MDLTEEDIEELISDAIDGIFERAYNSAIDAVLLIHQKNEPEEFVVNVERLRKMCHFSLVRQ
jgi:hypothetical protein